MSKISGEDLTMAANVLRGLSMDAVQKANSGHPGMPMGMAEVAAVLWLKYLKHAPFDPTWPDRDRFVLSAGHGSVLLYSLLHLAGYDLPKSELMQFRQWESRTPGHPEYGVTPGVETTTGPLGQGCGNAVGMALTECMLADRFNAPTFHPVDHYTYVICGDGDLMEGVSHEVFSLAGHLGLNKLIVFYDSNRITIEGSTDLTYSDDVKRRFQAYNWNVIEIDAHDINQIEKAIKKARREKLRPTIIISHSHIAQGSPNMHDSHEAHGAPLGEEEVAATKRNLGLPEDQLFYVPQHVAEVFDSRRKQLDRKARKWRREVKKHMAADLDWAERWRTFHENRLPDDLEAALPRFDLDKPLATRSASGKVIQALARVVPQLVGGSADLAPSTKTLIDGSSSVRPGSFTGRNLHFGVREHAMGAVLNGMAIHGGLRVYGSTFFVFADYCRPSIRLAALMKLPVTYVFTHDSFHVGEDGPTHQPVEQLSSLRCMPGITLIRPCDPTETSAAWLAALRNQGGPTALLLTRQNLPVIDRQSHPPASSLERGAYALWQSGHGAPQAILLASGSEVHLALDAAKDLSSEYNIRVVSIPSWELFERQPTLYRDDVLPPVCKTRLAIEAASSLGWERYTGDAGRTLAVNHFGASAPSKVLAEKFGFTTAHIVAMLREMLVAGPEITT